MASGIDKPLGSALRHTRALGTLLLCGCSLGLTSEVHAAPPRAYLAATIWTGDTAPIANGVMVVRDGKVLSVGARPGTTIPKDVEIVDLGAAVLMPGIVIAETTLGERGRDDDRTLTPEFLALDGFDFFADYSRALAGGVTTVQISPGSRRLMPGQGAVVKLAGDEPVKRVLSEREGLRIVLGDASRNPPRIYEPPVGAVSVERPLEPTRQQLSTSLAGAVAGIRATMRAAQEYRQATVRRGTRDNALGAVAANLEQGQRVRVTAPGSADIRAALGLAREFKWNLTLVDPAVPGAFSRGAGNLERYGFRCRAERRDPAGVNWGRRRRRRRRQARGASLGTCPRPRWRRLESGDSACLGQRHGRRPFPGGTLSAGRPEPSRSAANDYSDASRDAWSRRPSRLAFRW